MDILAWIVFGLIAGAIAKLVYPGPDPGGWLGTLLIGLVGAFVGGLIGRAVFARDVTGFNAWSLLFAVGGAVILLVIYRPVISNRGGRRVVT